MLYVFIVTPSIMSAEFYVELDRASIIDFLFVCTVLCLYYQPYVYIHN